MSWKYVQRNDETGAYRTTSEGGGSSNHNYSTTEQTIGTWIDGKPVYEVSYSGTSNNTTFSVNISALNLKRLVDGQISIIASGGNVKSIVYFANSTDLTRIWVSGSNLNVEIGSNYPARPVDYVITIQYTKTTD